MLDPIPSVNPGMGGSPVMPARTANPAAGAVGMNTDLAAPTLTATSQSDSTAAITQLCSAVAQLLQDVGGGLQDDKTLQMLIALMILLALLQNAQGANASNHDALAGLGSRANTLGQSAGTFASSTTIMFEQTTTTIFLHASETYNSAGTNGDAAHAQGGNIDLSI